MSEELEAIRTVIDWVKKHPSSNSRAFWCCGDVEHTVDCPVPAAEVSLARVEEEVARLREVENQAKRHREFINEELDKLLAFVSSLNGDKT